MKLRLLSRLILCILVPAIIGIALLATMDYRAARDALHRQINEDLMLISLREASELNNLVSMMQGVLQNIAMQNGIQTVFLSIQLGARQETIDKAVHEAQLILNNTAEHFSRIKEGGLIDLKGTVIVHTNSNYVGTDLSGRNYFKEALAGRSHAQTVVSQPGNVLTTSLSCPVTVNGKVIGALFFGLEMDQIAKSSIDTVKIANTGISFVYDRNGQMVMHPHRPYVGDQDGGLPWVREALNAREGMLRYQWDGRDKLLFFQSVPFVDWLVGISVEEKDIFAPVASMFQRALLLGGGITLVVGTLILLVARNLAFTLKAGSGLVLSVASGNLNITAEQKEKMDHACERGDEVGELAQGIRGMLENLERMFTAADTKTREAEAASQEARQAMAEAEAARQEAEKARREGMLAAAKQLESVVAIVDSASTGLSSHVAQSEKGATEQASRITETATAMEEMNSTVLEVARNAGTASDVSTQTRSRAEEGATVVQEVVDSIRQVRQDSLALKEDMSKLGEHAQAITQIISVISDIADQTNLLALNAAIEAARAGEAGRGFAVVADEVRKLAEKTMASTTDVGKAIRAIQESAQRSIQQADVAVNNIEKATQLAAQSGEALHEIVSMVDASADQVRAIATASEEQSATSEEINRAITEINGIAAETAGAMEEASRAVGDLTEQTRILTRLVEDMKRG